MAEGKITIPPPIGLLETDSYSAKANRVTSATSVNTTFEYTITCFISPAARVASLARAGVIGHVPALVSHACTSAWRRLESRDDPVKSRELAACNTLAALQAWKSQRATVSTAENGLDNC